MSVKYMAYGYEWVFSTSSEREVYMAMADHADQLGENIRPSIGLIAWKLDVDERTVRRNIKKLREKGILICVKDNARNGSPNHYKIDATQGVKKEVYRVGQNVQGTESEADKMSRVGRTPLSPTGSDIAMSYDPSLNRQLKPSEDSSVGSG